tara:strand:- start:481 stop:1815 length:1335 start_codon:yes stop_codon:yes gene_type:complete
MQLTDFSFSSTTFYGLGVEVSPENSLIKGAAFYGRLLKATPSVINGIPNPIGFSNPIFARKGFGGKVDIGTSKNAVTLAFFKASDDITSLLNDSTTAFVKPAENAVIGISTIQKLGKKIDCKGEIDYSAYNRNTRISEGQYPGFNYLNNMEPIFSANSATQFNRAIKASLNYKVKLYKIGLKYRRIDPDYQSMGAVYINNDFEDITANTTIKLLKSKLNFGGSGGLQRNNLLSDRAVSVIRLIGSLNANYNPNDHWAFSGAYSNFNSSSTQTLITGLDTVLFAQITKNANANVSFNNNNREKKLTIFCAGNYQIARVAKDSTVFYNVNLGAQYVITRLKAGITASMNLNQNIAALNNSAAYGPSIVFTKGIRKNIKINASFSYLTSLLEQEKSGQFINTRINVSYRYKKHHSLSSSISFIDKSLIVDDINSNEFIGMINYNYSF